MQLLPPPDGTYPICAVAHEDSAPHNAQSMYYQYRFYGIHGQWPTWADAIAHCSQPIQMAWESRLVERGVWSKPSDRLPIVEPPSESVHQAIGDIRSRGFGPDQPERSKP